MALDKQQLYEFMRYTINSEMVKALLVLEGMIKGMAIDGKINAEETAELENWFIMHKNLLRRQSLFDLYEVLEEALNGGYLSAEEKADIIWLCSSYTSNNLYFDLIFNDMQRLHGLLYGIIADNEIELLEIERLAQWLENNSQLCGVYPYDELCGMIKIVLEDGKLTIEERNMLKLFFSEFVDTKQSANLNYLELEELRKTITISGICAVNPHIVFQDRIFCFTGASSKANRTKLKAIIESKGGTLKNTVVKDTSYLIVCNKSNPCWAISCYGRKVEQAVNIRKTGSKILIIHEDDFWKQVEA